MKYRRSLLDSENLMDINISPLIDVVFILLIFFIVTTVFVEEPGVEIDKPVAATWKELEKNSILIAVTAQNQVVYGGKEIGINGVRAQVSRLNQKESMPVIIQVDENASAGVVMRVMDEANYGKAKSVNISTERPRS